jgi:alkylation response protein AidB-like acyl-CoA dehydrogenase
MNPRSLSESKALWNRSDLDLRSDEVLAQILDRGEVWAWRELYRLARDDRELRQRIRRVVQRVPLAHARFWLAALADLGEAVDLGMALPEDLGI